MAASFTYWTPSEAAHELRVASMSASIAATIASEQRR
jgi:hypothetical protein